LRAVLNTDGGARGNPGPAGIGVVLKDADGIVIDEIAQPIGVTTNNVAEYEALIAGLKLALDHNVTELDIYVDSELVASQLEGKWKIKNERLRGLAVTARALMGRFDKTTIRHVRRSQNTHADRLANQAMDRAEAAPGNDDPDQGSLLS
jgi:probable phosphoglycerate mutase